MARDRSSLERPPRPAKVTLQPGILLRLFALACLAVIGSAWAVVRFYTHVRPAKDVPAPQAITEGDAGAELLPAPEIEIQPR